MEAPELPPIGKVIWFLKVHYLNEVGSWTENLTIFPFLSLNDDI